MHRQPPIFILGITQRSGTNYLRDLLCHHPDCHHGGPVWEDFLLSGARLLLWYSRYSYNQWDTGWRVPEIVGPRPALHRDLGTGLIRFLHRQFLVSKKYRVLYDENQPPLPARLRLVSKTPSVENLPLFFEFFPQAKLLILIRDGRAVTESTVKTFGRPAEIAMRDWRHAAQTLLDFQRNDTPWRDNYLLVRYEDLFEQTELELRRILEFLALDDRRYDFASAIDQPIIGSSDSLTPDQLSWQRQKKTTSFSPTQRFSHWTARQHARFSHVAGAVSHQLGYPVPTSPTQPLDLVLDSYWEAVWQLRWWAKKVVSVGK